MVIISLPDLNIYYAGTYLSETAVDTGLPGTCV